MSYNKKAFEYENHVFNCVKQLGLNGNMQEPGGCGSFSNGDIDIKLNEKIYNIEIKMNKNAQMGGTSVKYFKNAKHVELINSTVDKQLQALVIEAVKNKQEDLDRFIEYYNQNNTDNNVEGFPLTCTKDFWNEAAKMKLLVNSSIEFDESFISNFYASKNVHYIQIGKAGLFYLKENPANIPVPKLQGKVNIEIRTARSGSKKLSSGQKVVGGGIRVQGRLKTKNISPYTLDNPDSIKEMLKKMGIC